MLTVLIGLFFEREAMASTATVSRTAADYDRTYGTKGILTVKTSITLNAPLNPVKLHTAKSKGGSNISFYKNIPHGETYKITRKRKSHTIVSRIGGIGSAEFDLSGTDVVKKKTDKSADFTTVTLSDQLVVEP